MRKKIFSIIISMTVFSVIATAIIIMLLASDFVISKEPTLLSTIIESRGLLYFISLAVPALVGILVLTVLASIYVSTILSNDLIRTIRNVVGNFEAMLDDREVENYKIYEEFSPFIKIFEFQKTQIDLQMEKLKDANVRRREFTANVSHELKTPLVSINGYAEMIENGMAKEEDIKNFAGIIKKQGNILLDLINEIIELSKLEDEDFVPDYTNVVLGCVVKSTFDRLKFVADRKNITLTIEGDATINGNLSLITEMVYNIVENSIKYGVENGETRVVIEPGEFVKMRFIDNGIGIPKEEQERVFERFYRVDKSHSKKIEGTGLGLAIVKHVAEIHKGTVAVQSEPCKGTEMTVVLPVV